MKKLLFIIICSLALALGGTGGTAGAETERYARAMNTTAYFFSQKDLSTSLFAVPYTYCVRILRDDGQWYYVQYAEDEGIYRALYGYVLKSDFAETNGPPEVTYLFKSITITYTAGEGDSSLPTLGGIEMQAAFYGTYYSGATAYSYVLCGDSFGYVPGANDDYPLNQTDDATEEPAPSTGGSAGSPIVTAVIIAALAAGAVVVLYLSSKKRKNG